MQSISRMSFSKVGLLRPILSRTMVSSVRSNLLARKVNSRIVSRVLFSTDASAKETPKSEEATQTDTKQNQLASQNYDDYDDYYDEPVTPADKVRRAAKDLFWWGLLIAGIGCIYLLIKEIMPSRMSANGVYSDAFETLKIKDEIRAIVGEPMKAYGRDVGKNTEGRRNFVDNRQYVAPDGSARTRVRFHIEGPLNKIRVWAEVSNKMADNEYVYLIVQDLKTGRILTLVDERARLDQEYEESLMGAGQS